MARADKITPYLGEFASLAPPDALTIANGLVDEGDRLLGGGRHTRIAAQRLSIVSLTKPRIVNAVKRVVFENGRYIRVVERKIVPRFHTGILHKI